MEREEEGDDRVLAGWFFLAVVVFALCMTWLSGCAQAVRGPARHAQAEACATFSAPAEVVEIPAVQSAIEKIDAHGTVLVVFTSKGCEICRRMKGVFAELQRAEGFSTHVIDRDANAALAAERDVAGLPCFIVYRDGVEDVRFSGEHSKAEILDCLNGK